MRIDDFLTVGNVQDCNGCMACHDACPHHCIERVTNDEGFVFPHINSEPCINCGRCYQVCPQQHALKNEYTQHLYAVYALNHAERMKGSSGGVFGLLARQLIEKGYYVCGAAFDDDLTLKHRLISSVEELYPLLKSKYLQSDTQDVFSCIKALLSEGKKVFFCGTPCQVSALKNMVSPNDCLLTADIICHGVPSQKLFDDYLKTLQKKENGKITDFTFRVKDNAYRHAHGYSYSIVTDKKEQKHSGIYSESSYYYAFKEYLTFRKSCYACHYATVERVSDLTLGDFWNLEKYDSSANTDTGVSMIITNTEVGQTLLKSLDAVNIKEYPLQYGIDSNYCLTKATHEPLKRDEIFAFLKENGYEATAARYFSGGTSLKYRIYWKMPPTVRNFLRKIRGKLNV